MLRMSLSAAYLDLHLSGATAMFARRRCLRVPRDRIHRAFVLRRSFAVDASPRIPCPGWTSPRSRIGVFGFRDSAQLWSAGAEPVVLALYLRGSPYHRIVYDVPDPSTEASIINRWLDGNDSEGQVRGSTVSEGVSPHRGTGSRPPEAAQDHAPPAEIDGDGRGSAEPTPR